MVHGVREEPVALTWPCLHDEDGFAALSAARGCANPAGGLWNRASPDSVDDHGAVDTVTVARVTSEERRRIVFGLRRQEAIVAAKPPTIVRRIPLHAAADIADEERLVFGDVER